MSFEALAWAAKQNPGTSGTKLVLLALAECADRSHHLAFPSIAALVEFSALDRKSVIANLDRLAERGFITDTGRKVGKTGQIKVYQLNLGTVPEKVSQKRNSSEKSANSPENGTRNLSEPPSEAKASSTRVVESWNVMADANKGRVRRAEVIDASRTQTIIRRVKAYGEDQVLKAITLVPQNAWLLGKGRDSNWKPNLEWFLRPDTLRKLLEHVYGDIEETDASGRWSAEGKAAYLAKFREGEVAPVGSLAKKILGDLH